MKIPQLVQEIIDYYLYFVPWKARIKCLNTNYNEQFYAILNYRIKHNYGFVCNWRNVYKRRQHAPYTSIYNIQEPNKPVARLPPRYIYSNTKEQLKSLFLSSNY